jgi:hypothetical protein
MAATIISTLSKDPNALSPILRSPPTRLAAGFTGSTTAFVTRGRSRSNAPGKRGSLVVQMAASKEKKSRDLDMLKGMLSNDDTLLVAGFRFQGLSVRKLGKPYKPIFIFFPAGCWSLVPALQVGTGRIKAKKPRATHVIFE